MHNSRQNALIGTSGEWNNSFRRGWAGDEIPARFTHDTYVIGRTTMKKLLGLLLVLIPVVALAQSGIDGIWRIDLSKTQLDSKPRGLSVERRHV